MIEIKDKIGTGEKTSNVEMKVCGTSEHFRFFVRNNAGYYVNVGIFGDYWMSIEEIV